MKRVILWISLLCCGVLAVAIFFAFQLGVKSPIFAGGTVSLSPLLTEDAKNIRTLFITVFDADSPMPMPYGAMKEHLDGDPQGDFYHFQITPEKLQIMNPNLPPPKKIRLKARLDIDGQGGMDQKGDLVGEIAETAMGNTGVSIVIDKKM